MDGTKIPTSEVSSTASEQLAQRDLVDSIEPTGFTEIAKGLNQSRVNRRDLLEHGSFIVIGGTSALIAFGAFLVARSARNIATHQSNIMDQQSVLMEQQNQLIDQQLELQEASTPPIFRISAYSEKFIDSLPLAQLSEVALENIGGIARYLEIRPVTRLRFSDGSIASRYVELLSAQVFQYFSQSNELYRPGETDRQWLFDTDTALDKINRYIKDIHSILDAEPGLSEVNVTIDHKFSMMYEDQSGAVRDDEYYVRPTYSGNDKRMELSVNGLSEDPYFTMVDVESIGKAPAYIPLYLEADSPAWKLNVSWIASLISKRFKEVQVVE